MKFSTNEDLIAKLRDDAEYYAKQAANTQETINARMAYNDARRAMNTLIELHEKRIIKPTTNQH